MMSLMRLFVNLFNPCLPPESMQNTTKMFAKHPLNIPQNTKKKYPQTPQKKIRQTKGMCLIGHWGYQ